MQHTHISAFDLDRTLIKGNASFAFFLYLLKKGSVHLKGLLYSPFYFLRHRYFDMTLKQLHESVFKRFLQGVSLPYLERHVDGFVKTKFERLCYEPALRRLREAQERGDYTMILSNSPHFLVGPIAAHLGVDEWKATEYGIDSGGHLSRIESLFQGREKALYLEGRGDELGVPRESITAYSDSHLDLPFLSAAGKAVVVNPDYRLRRASKRHAWEEI